MRQIKCEGLSEGLAKMFATPSLMNGEEEQVYHELYGLVEAATQPKDIWDQMLVSDVVCHFWEQRRLRRCNGAIINANRRLALEQILHATIGLTPPEAKRAADRYFNVSRMPFSEYDPDRTGQTPSTRDDLIMFLNERGVTEADIDRVALQVSVDVLFDLERLALKHELRCETIRDELERRRERREKQGASAVTAMRKGRGGVIADASPIELREAPPSRAIRSHSSAPFAAGFEASAGHLTAADLTGHHCGFP